MEPSKDPFIHEKAWRFSMERHKGQKDENGEDYYKAHLLPVAYAVKEFTNDPEVIAAAWLHDILEDTDTYFAELVTLFGPRVASLVNEVTHDGKKDEYGFFFPRLKSPEAVLIKLCDRASNISRMQSWGEKRKAHYLKKTKFWKDGSDRK